MIEPAVAAPRHIIGAARCGIRLLGRPASEYGRSCHGDGGHEGGGRCRRAFMLTILLLLPREAHSKPPIYSSGQTIALNLVALNDQRDGHRRVHDLSGRM